MSFDLQVHDSFFGVCWVNFWRAYKSNLIKQTIKSFKFHLDVYLKSFQSLYLIQIVFCVLEHRESNKFKNPTSKEVLQKFRKHFGDKFRGFLYRQKRVFCILKHLAEFSFEKNKIHSRFNLNIPKTRRSRDGRKCNFAIDTANVVTAKMNVAGFDRRSKISFCVKFKRNRKWIFISDFFSRL